MLFSQLTAVTEPQSQTTSDSTFQQRLPYPGLCPSHLFFATTGGKSVRGDGETVEHDGKHPNLPRSNAKTVQTSCMMTIVYFCSFDYASNLKTVQ